LAQHQITFKPDGTSIEMPTGSTIAEAILEAGLEISQPCGGQGRCGRCAVIVEGENVRRRSTLRLSSDDVQAGYALACQTIIEGDVVVEIPEQEKIERLMVTDRSARKIELPFAYDPSKLQSVRAYELRLALPTLDDNIDDLTRLQRGLAEQDLADVHVPLPVLRKLGETLRQADGVLWVVVDRGCDTQPAAPARVIDLSAEPLKPLGLAIDIGTTTVSVFLVDLESGEVLASAAEYNEQINFGEDVISRIVFAGKGDGLQQLSDAVRQTIHTLLERLQKRTQIDVERIYKVTVAGNTTMTHLFLGLPPSSIRLTPYIPTANYPPPYSAHELGLGVNPMAAVDTLPGVASYVGADITAGVLSTKLLDSDALTLFIDIGTNGETVLGTRDWMVSCACSAGPAFEGAGVLDGMRATKGAIEEVWVNSQDYEPTYRVIGNVKPRGLCGSALISLLAELFVTGVIDRSGTVKLDLETPRVRQGDHGPEYVVAWGKETERGKDIVLTKVDVENLMRTKAAIYAGFSVLASKVGIELGDVQHVLIGGAFGQYINVEKAIQIGLLPDLPWDRFRFLGNTAVQGSYAALLSRPARDQVAAIANAMTYVELSADNTFYDAFTAALFLPHTEIRRFPSVAEIWQKQSASGSRSEDQQA
jgi:uncharacterized 2Fe-2S/4Fe-4S cluster protein (DUF4445 family)